MIRVLVSSCLLGERVRYDGGDLRLEVAILKRWIEQERVVPFCPEVAGGLSVPRPPAEIRGGTGLQVLDHDARVFTVSGEDVSRNFIRGAELALEACRTHDVGLAILVDGSPSCGSGEIHDGSFSGKRRHGEGVTTALLERSGVRVFSEDQLAGALTYLEELEERTTGSPAP